MAYSPEFQEIAHCGGKVIVSDIMSDPTHTQPVFSTLFSLQMLLASKEGAVFSPNECEAWMARITQG